MTVSPETRSAPRQVGPAAAGLSAVRPELASAQRVCYGRELEPLACRDGSEVRIAFEAAAVHSVQMQWRVRLAGLDFELQFADPAALWDVDAALSPAVPLGLQRAAVLHAAEALLEAIEQRLGTRVELTGLSCGRAPAWAVEAALCLNVSMAGVAPPRRCTVLLRALQADGWRVIERAASTLALSPAAHDPSVALRLVCDPVTVGIGALRGIEPGDVLLLDARAAAFDRLPAGLQLAGRARAVQHLAGHRPAGRPLPGIGAEFDGSRLHITRVRADPADLDRAASERLTSSRSDSMPSPELGGSAGPFGPVVAEPAVPRHLAAGRRAPVAEPPAGPPGGGSLAESLDDLQVDIEIELGRLSLPLSAVRTLAVGQVFETARPSTGDGLVLRCGGRVLGIGRLVTIGDRLGVRVMALQSASGADEASPAPGAP